MSLQLFRKLPKEVFVACSGGVDSVALSLFLKDTGRDVTLVHYNHPDDPLAEKEEAFVRNLKDQYGFSGMISSWNKISERKGSREAWWRENRQSFFRSLGKPVLTGHHLDDAVEWYVMTSLLGEGHYMKYDTGFTLKPFLTQNKESIIRWMRKHHPEVEWIDDPTNHQPGFSKRNFVRLKLIPELLKFNPGLFTTVKNNLIKKNKK